MIPEQGTKEFTDYLLDIKNGKIKHKYFSETEEIQETMAVHVDGVKPEKLLKINRPHEDADIRKYRLEVYKPVTASLSGKVFTTVNKIFNQRFYSVKFKENPSIIKEGQGLDDYFDNYPIYGSLMNYIQETAIKKTFGDPNGACLIFPRNLDISETEYYEPVPYYVPSYNIKDFKDNEYFVISYNDDKKDIITIIDKVSYREYEFYSNGKESGFTLSLEVPYNFGFPPIFRNGGLIQGKKEPFYYKSFIQDCAPHWDKVVTMTSDLDGSIVNHLYPERWEWQVECKTCSGSGIIKEEKKFANLGDDQFVEYGCTDCSGTGQITSRSPFGALTVSREALNPDLPQPTPPADYITKDIEPIRELRDLIDSEEKKGFSSINLEILNKVGDNQSGRAKEIDRSDLDSFLLKISNHMFKYYIPNVIWLTELWRYGVVLSPQQLTEYYPEINPPKEFSVLSTSDLMEEYKNASNSEVSSFYLRTIEEEIVNAKFATNEDARKKGLAIIKLNPFPSKTSDDLLTDMSQGTVKKEDWIKYNYIESLVETAIDQNENFLDLTYTEQNTVLDEIIKNQFNDIKPTIPNES